jgi:hypothetical protein
MKHHLSPAFFAGVVALTTIASATWLAYAENPTDSGLSFTVASFNFHAEKQEDNGLLRGVTITENNRKFSDPTMIIYARSARKDPKQAQGWILGDVVVHTFGSDKTQSSETRCKTYMMAPLTKSLSPKGTVTMRRQQRQYSINTRYIAK